MMWRGKLKCFSETVRIIRNYDILDSKGTTGEEYYLSAGIQKSNTNVNPIDYSKNNFVKLWNYQFYVKDLNFFINGYDDKLDIVHYGNFNYYNKNIQKLLKKFNPDIKFDMKDRLYTVLQMFKKMLRKFYFNE